MEFNVGDQILLSQSGYDVVRQANPFAANLLISSGGVSVIVDLDKQIATLSIMRGSVILSVPRDNLEEMIVRKVSPEEAAAIEAVAQEAGPPQLPEPMADGPYPTAQDQSGANVMGMPPFLQGIPVVAICQWTVMQYLTFKMAAIRSENFTVPAEMEPNECKLYNTAVDTLQRLLEKGATQLGLGDPRKIR